MWSALVSAVESHHLHANGTPTHQNLINTQAVRDAAAGRAEEQPAAAEEKQAVRAHPTPCHTVPPSPSVDVHDVVTRTCGRNCSYRDSPVCCCANHSTTRRGVGGTTSTTNHHHHHHHQPPTPTTTTKGRLCIFVPPSPLLLPSSPMQSRMPITRRWTAYAAETTTR